MIAEDRLRQAIRLTQAEFQGGVGQAGIIDVAFIGNTSEAYVWEPAQIVDIDVCVFVKALDSQLGLRLLAMRKRLLAEWESIGADFELKVLRGPYKPAAWRLLRPIAIAHVAVFTEMSYRHLSPAIRWAWRKYRCTVDPDRLAVTAQEPPGWQELRAMAGRKRGRIEAGRIEMTEWELPELVERLRGFDVSHPVFAEYCLAGSLVCARHHGRILRCAEADQLSNRPFVSWYRREVMDSLALEELLELKEASRQEGFAGLVPEVKKLSVQYLGELIRWIDGQSQRLS